MDNSTCRLLLVEDDPVDRMALKRLLKKERLAFQTSIADSLARAKEILATEYFDVVVADYRLGDGTALDLFGLVHGAPVIVVTGGGDEAVAIQAMKAGAFDYLIKDREHNYLNFLPVVVQQAINHRETEQRIRRNHDMQSTINAVLRISLQNIPLKAQLEQILGHVLAIPWLLQGSQGCIFLFDGTPHSELLASTCQYLSQKLLKQQIQQFKQSVHAKKEMVVDVVFEQHEAMPGIYRTAIVSGTKALGLWLLQVPAGEGQSKEVAAFLTAIADTLAGIIERKRMDEALRQAKDHAEAANKAKSEFLANISHELRTPMNAIIGMTDLAQQCHDDKEQQMFLGIVQKSAGTLMDLLNGIIDYANIEAERLELVNIPFDLRQVFADIADLVGHKVREKKLLLEWRISPELPTRLQGDPFRLRQVIQQLVDNAIKFTERGKVLITANLASEVKPSLSGELQLQSALLKQNQQLYGEVDTSIAQENWTTRGNKDQKNRRIHCTIIVTDTGIGIAKSWHTAVFDVFTQVDGSSTRKIGGTGLGLAISKRLVELMKGQIGLTSSLGHGSQFFFTLPLDLGAETETSYASILPSFSSPQDAPAPIEENVGKMSKAKGSLADHFTFLEQALAQENLSEVARESGNIRSISENNEIRSKAFHVLLAARKGDLPGTHIRMEQLRNAITQFATHTPEFKNLPVIKE